MVQRVKSYADLTSSPAVTEPVISALNLDLTPRQLREMVTVTSPADSVLLDVEVTDTDPQRASAIANAVAHELAALIEELETPRGTDASTVKVTITKPSVPPETPSAPRVLMNLALGLAAGLAIGFVVAVVRHLFDRRLKTLDDLRAIAGVSVLGETLHNRNSVSRPLTALDVRSAAAERYRGIRAALKFADVNKPVRQLAITSPRSGEGKSTLACNLAIVFAHGGLRTCLVEADLRRPNAHRYMGIEAGLGLTDVLIGDAQLPQVVVPWDDGLVDFLPAGSLPPDPVALLESRAMQKLAAHLAAEYDIVIYDCPPVRPVTDALVLAQWLDGVVVVARAGRTSREDLAACVEAVNEAKLRLLGTALSDVRGSKDSYYDAKAGRGGAALTEITLPTETPLLNASPPAVEAEDRTTADPR